MDQDRKLRTIYAHIFPDNSMYIGQTSTKNLNIRWGYNGGGYDNQETMRKAIEFWGWGLIEHKILEQGEMTKEEVLKKECDFTLEYVNKGYKLLNKCNTENPCRYRVKHKENTYKYVDVTTGKEYKSLRAVGIDLGVSHEAVRISIKEDRPLRNGHKIEMKIVNINIVLEEDK